MAKRKKVPERLRVPSRLIGPDVISGRRPVVSMRHGYLWIGGEDGPCAVHISGKATLLKIAAMLTAHAR